MVGRRGQEGGPAEERVASAVALAGAAFSRALVPSALTPARPSHTALFQHAAPCHCRRPPPVHAMLHATPSCITRIAQGLAVVLAASCSVRAERVDGCEGDCVNGAGTYTFPDGTVYTVRACVRLCVWKPDPCWRLRDARPHARTHACTQHARMQHARMHARAHSHLFHVR